MEKVWTTLNGHPHLEVLGNGEQFLVRHYAGDVTYDVDEFCFKNYDNLYTSLVMCMQTSNNQFFRSLFPEDVTNEKSTPTTSGTKIRQSANSLMQKLAHCTPHYIRCIKPNPKKQAMTFNGDLVEHQVKYLGLLENVRVKRAGYAYRHYFEIFFKRFAPLMDQPPMSGGADGCQQLVNFLCSRHKLASDEFGVGRSKIFVKSPETIWTLEEILEQKLDPEGYKLKVKLFKENEAKAKAAHNPGLKPKCVIQ
jgi:myosin-1